MYYSVVRFSDRAYGVCVVYGDTKVSSYAFCEGEGEAEAWAKRLLAAQVYPCALLEVLDENLQWSDR